MVNNKTSNFKFSLFTTVLLCAICITPAFSQPIISGKIHLNTGWLRLKIPGGLKPVGTHNIWTSGASAKIGIEVGGQTIKGYVSATYFVDTPNIAEFFTTGNKMGVQQSAELSRSYVKIRLPWFKERKMRLNIGKMPVSWGYGMVYNAGDIIFGALPPNSSESQLNNPTITKSSLSELRQQADWFVQASLPIAFGLNFEPLLRIPLSLDTLQNKGQKPSFGGRLLWTPYWHALESAEAGYLASRDGKTHYAYGALDGNLYFDYTLCTQTSIATSSHNSPDIQWVVSGALSKGFIITNYNTGYEMPLSIRLESLWIPTQNNHSLLFALVFAQLTDILAIALNWTGTMHNGFPSTTPQVRAEHIIFIGLTLTPIQGLEFTLSTVFDAKKPTHTAGITLSTTYRF